MEQVDLGQYDWEWEERRADGEELGWNGREGIRRNRVDDNEEMEEVEEEEEEELSGWEEYVLNTTSEEREE